jgi:hypothetical protein
MEQNEILNAETAHVDGAALLEVGTWLRGSRTSTLRRQLRTFPTAPEGSAKLRRFGRSGTCPTVAHAVSTSIRKYPMTSGCQVLERDSCSNPCESLTTPLMAAWFDWPNATAAAKQTNSNPLNIPMFVTIYPFNGCH